MIFYFTGTGNSLYAAQRIREVTGDRAISMAKCLLEDDLDYKMYSNERIGFVFPTHCWGTPWLVDQFLDRLTIKPSDGYGDDEERLDATFVYAVITCGSSIGNADKMLAKKLAKKGIKLNAIYSLKMVDNYVTGFDIVSEEKQAKIMEKCDTELRRICADLLNRRDHQHPDKSAAGIALSKLNKLFKSKGRGTKDFYADDSCVGCGLCESICPIGCIKLGEDRKPEWTLESCAFCLGCINRCPHRAIQFGKKTQKRGRFVNPIFTEIEE